MEDRIFKIIVLTCLIIIVATVVVTAALILNDKLKTPTTTSIPPSNQTVNNTSNQQSNPNPTSSGQTSHTHYITADQAINVVKSHEAIPSAGVRYSAKLITNTAHPYYYITVYGTDPSKPGYNQAVGGAKVDAVTGKFLGGMG